MLWLFLLIPPIILVPYLGNFLFQPGSRFSDLLISHLPNAVFLQHSITQWHTLPFWSPLILSGYPFAADPLSGMWYPPCWLTVLLPSALGFNLVFILHLVWGGVGMYRFLRLEGLGKPAAVFGGIFFELLPKVWAHDAVGHITLVYAVSWMPWLLLAEKASQREEPGRFRLPPGIVWGIVVLADVRWGAFAAAIWLGYRFYQRVITNLASEAAGGVRQRIKSLFSRSGRFVLPAAVQLVMGICVAAPLVFPLFEYSGLSTRSQMTPADVLSYSLPPARLLGLIFPDPGGPAEWTLYASEIGFMLVVLALARKSIRRRINFWILVLAASVIFALGSAIPFMDKLAILPGLDLLRVPARSLFASGFSFIIMASTALDELLMPGKLSQDDQKVKPEIFISGALDFMILLAGVVWLVQGSLAFPMIWGVLWGLFAVILTILRLRNLIPPPLTYVLALVFLLADLGGVDRLSFEPRNSSEIETGASSAVDYLAKEAGIFRIYSPSYSIPQDLAAISGLSLADGVDPLQLRSYAQFMQGATGVPFSGYSVTLPPFHTGNPSTDNQAYQPDLRQLGLLNVKYLSASYDLQQPGLTLRARFGDTRVYENLYSRERAWVQSSPTDMDSASRAVTILPSDPNHFLAQASGPGMLVLSEIQYPGWQVRVDGVRQPVETIDGIFRGVGLGPGSHQVEFEFQPVLVYGGLVLALCAWLWVAFQFFSLRRGTRDPKK